MLQSNMSLLCSYVWCWPIQITSENNVQVLSFQSFFFSFVQNTPLSADDYLIFGKRLVKRLPMHHWKPIGIPSIAAAEQGVGTDAAQQLCPCGVRGLSNTSPTALGIHKHCFLAHHLPLIMGHRLDLTTMCFFGLFLSIYFCASHI